MYLSSQAFFLLFDCLDQEVLFSLLTLSRYAYWIKPVSCSFVPAALWTIPHLKYEKQILQRHRNNEVGNKTFLAINMPLIGEEFATAGMSIGGGGVGSSLRRR